MLQRGLLFKMHQVRAVQLWTGSSQGLLGNILTEGYSANPSVPNEEHGV